MNELAREREVFPRESVAGIFRRLNPKVENLKKEEVIRLLEVLWSSKALNGEEGN